MSTASAFPSIRATTSSGSSTHSSVRPRTNSPGWMTNGSASVIAICSVRFVGGLARSIAAVRWLWKTRNVLPRRRSTLAGWTIAGIPRVDLDARPRRTRRRIVPSDRTEAGALMRVGSLGAVVARAAPRRGRLSARRGARGRRPCARAQAPARRARRAGRGAGCAAAPGAGAGGAGAALSGFFVPPSSSVTGSGCGGFWIAYQTMYSSAKIGSFRTTIRKMKVALIGA